LDIAAKVVVEILQFTLLIMVLMMQLLDCGNARLTVDHIIDFFITTEIGKIRRKPIDS
jgi:hypothetical protein